VKKQVAVIGMGRFGISLARSLYSIGHEVLAIDIDGKKVENIASEITHAVQADATKEPVLKELGISNFDMAIVTMGTAIQNSVLSTILLKKLGVPYVISRAGNDLHGSILEKIGADKVVYVEHEMGIRVSHGLALKGVLDYISVTPTYGVAKIAVPLYFVGRTLSDLGFGRGGKWKITVLLIQRENEIIITPDRSEMVKSNDSMVIVGSDENIEQLVTEAKEK
jgi:trk system potassium uptake protein TrkA